MMANETYSHDEQGRLILAGELGRLALVRAKTIEGERWQPYHWEYHGTAGAYTLPQPPEPNERPAAKEFNALWEENTRIREELRKMREDIRGLTQALMNMRKEANLSRASGTKSQTKERPLSGL